MIRRGDLVTITHKDQRLPAVVVRYSQDPDREWLVMDGRGDVRKRYEDACEPVGVYTNGKQHLSHDEAETRRRILDRAESAYGKAAIAAAKTPPNVIKRRDKPIYVHSQEGGPGGYPTHVLPGGTGGAPAATDVPLVLADDTGTPTPQLLRYLAVGDDAEHAHTRIDAEGNKVPVSADERTSVSAEERDMRTLDRLRRENPAAYRRQVDAICQHRKPADIAHLLGISLGAAIKRRQRARVIHLDRDGAL